MQVTDAPLGVESFDWSADGASLAFTARVPEKGRYGTVEGLDAAAEAPRHITGIRWHANGLGYLADRPAHVFVVRAPDDRRRAVLRARRRRARRGRDPPEEAARRGRGDARSPPVPASHAGAVFRGDEVLTVVDEIESDRRDLRSRLVAVRADGSGEREVLGREANLSIAEVAVADDGVIALLAFDAGESGIDFVAPGVALWLIEDGGPRRLTDAETIDLGEVGSHITAVGDDFLVQDRTRGRVRLLRVTRAGEVDRSARRRRRGRRSRGGGGAGRRVGRDPALARRARARRGRRAAHADLVRRGCGRARRPRELTIDGRDGYPIHGWVAQPAGEGPFPVILQIHGGPYATYGIHLFDETQVLVDAGYAVVYCNPRGSAGYGRAHGRSIRGAMGTVDFADVIDFLEGAVAADARLDGDRVGIMGGSYGGYLTAWVIAHDHRFAGAIVERGFLDPAAFQGTSDIGSFFGDEYVGTDPDGDRAAESDGGRRSGHDAHARHPLGAGLPLPARAGDPLLLGAQAAGDRGGAAGVPGREPRAHARRASRATASSGSPRCSTGGAARFPSRRRGSATKKRPGPAGALLVCLRPTGPSCRT